MADERYQWLDEETAERLLRGEPADPADDLARLRARRLAAALDAVRAPAAGDELPGEAAALAAFREAGAARAAAVPGPASTPVSAPGTPADLGRVRLARVSAPPRRWGRSARYGLAAAVAAVAVGGVAVAAGTGALPLVGPAPASSVSAGDTARPLLSPEPDGIREDLGIPGPPPPGEDRTPRPSPSTGTDAPAPTAPAPDGGDGAEGDGEAEGDGPNRPKRDVPEPGRSTAGTDGTPDPDRTGGRDRDRDGDGNGGMEFREKAVEACRAYRSGKLDDDSRRKLTNTLRDGETLRRYCDRLLSGATGTPGDAPKGGAKDRPGTGGSGNRPGDGFGDGAKGDGRPGGGGSWNRGGGARPSDRPLAGPASATPGGLPETGATTRLPLAV
ncbi:hypothetical protein [Streptomyces sp. S1]|uniref:hypothetical protein n=1 Tax=Streptomyces sp. S1 TaxID=718288 RepID=UPI003D761019